MEVKLYVRTQCHKCNGSGLIDCVYCGGTGTMECPNCYGDGYIEEEAY